MSKVYILEPVELTFVDPDATCLVSPGILSYEQLESLPDRCVFDLSGTKYKFAGLSAGGADFTIDGNTPEDGSTDYCTVAVLHVADGYTNTIYAPLPGTYTISIYTETEDEDTKPYIDEKLSKNVTYTDHPHNNWEEVLSKKGDPKTGYNTIEKIANASSESGGGSSSGGGIMKLTFTEDPNNAGTYVCDHTWQEIYDAVSSGINLGSLNPYDGSDDGFNGLTMLLYTDVTIVYGDGMYGVSLNSGTIIADTETADGYPSWTE